MKIEGKVAVISGGGSGIGRAAVLALVGRGARVVVADIDEDGGRRTVDMASERGGVTVFRRCDVTKTEDLASAFDLAIERFGRLDIAFNNAGIIGASARTSSPTTRTTGNASSRSTSPRSSTPPASPSERCGS
jgi:NAD(P)-dependent dehydrogenase (short-subunit alcohol dehydrogenase family)